MNSSHKSFLIRPGIDAYKIQLYAEVNGTQFYWTPKRKLGVFIKSRQHKNANIANFVLAILLKRNLTNNVYNF